MELNIIEGQIKRPLKVVIYGSEGIGKTTVAAHSIEPLFIDTEGGTAHLNVRRIPRPDSWNELLAIIYEIAASPGLCRTLVCIPAITPAGTPRTASACLRSWI